MGNKFRFIDDKTSKAKKTHFTHTEEEIILTLPDESGVVVTTNTVNDILDVDDNGNPISGYILKPDIGDNAGINEESNNELIPRAEYVTSNAYVGPLEWTRWEASLTDDFSNLVDSTSDPKDKDEWLPNVSGRGIGVYVRYRFHSGVLRSPFSDTIHYKTPTYGINPFVITVNDSIKPLIRTSEFSVFGEEICGPINHVATTWVIKRADDNVVVFKSERDTKNLLKIQIGVGILEELTNYIVYVTYHTDNDLVPNSVTRSMSFISPRVYIETPVLKHVGDNSILGIVFNTINGSKYKINNTDEPHLYTKWELFTLENNKKTLVYSVDSTNFKESFDISRLATNNNIEYLCEATYYSANYHSETGSVKFKVTPFRSPNLRIITLNQNTDLFGNTANAELKNIYNYLEDGYRFENVRFKVMDCAKWDNGKYVVSKEIFDLAYGGPIVLITSEDFEIDKKMLTPTTALNFERIIVRIIDKYNNTDNSQPWLNAVGDESTVTAINKENIQSFLVPVENNKYRRYYFFYPLLLDKPYNDKQHKVLENYMDISLYFEHTKYVTEAVTTDKSIALAFSGCKSAFQYMYNNVAYNLNSVGSFTFRLNPNIKPKPTTTYTYNYPYILKQFGNKLPMNVTFYDNGNKVTTYISPWNDNTSGEVTLRNEIANKISYNKEYTVIPSLRIGNMFNIVLDTKTVTFKPSELIAPIPTIKTTPVTDIHMRIDISNVKYEYKSYSPVFNPAGSVSSVDYNCDPKSIRYVITKDSNGSVVYDKTFTDQFETTTMDNAYKVIPVKSLLLKTYKNDYDEPGDLVLSYSTKYKLSITMTAKNGVTKTSYATFNTGAKPVIIINKPTITATQIKEASGFYLNPSVIANSDNYSLDRNVNGVSSKFTVTGLEDKTHKATEWAVFESTSSTTPLYSKKVTNTNNLTEFRFNISDANYKNKIQPGKTYVFAVRYQAANNQWSEYGKTTVKIQVPQDWLDIPVAATHSFSDSVTDYYINSLRHPYMKYGQRFKIRWIVSTGHMANDAARQRYNGLMSTSSNYTMFNEGVPAWERIYYRNVAYYGTDPSAYKTFINIDKTCLTLSYNADVFLEFWDGTSTGLIHTTSASDYNSKLTKFGFTQEEKDCSWSGLTPLGTQSGNGIIGATRRLRPIDFITADNLYNNISLSNINGVLHFNNYAGHQKYFYLTYGFEKCEWTIKKRKSDNSWQTMFSPVTINQYLIDGTGGSGEFLKKLYTHTELENAGITFNDVLSARFKLVNDKYSYSLEQPIFYEFILNMFVSPVFFKLQLDAANKKLKVVNAKFKYDNYVDGYIFCCTRRNNDKSLVTTSLNLLTSQKQRFQEGRRIVKNGKAEYMDGYPIHHNYNSNEMVTDNWRNKYTGAYVPGASTNPLFIHQQFASGYNSNYIGQDNTGNTTNLDYTERFFITYLGTSPTWNIRVNKIADLIGKTVDLDLSHSDIMGASAKLPTTTSTKFQDTSRLVFELVPVYKFGSYYAYGSQEFRYDDESIKNTDYSLDDIWMESTNGGYKLIQRLWSFHGNTYPAGRTILDEVVNNERYMSYTSPTYILKV